MIPQGRILIERAGNGVVQIKSNRVADIGRLMIGRSPEQVIEMLPLLFSLCKHAHVAAARQAMAIGSPDQHRRDTVMVLAENAREHLLRILMGWQSDRQTCTLNPTDIMALTTRMKTAAGRQDAENAEASHLAGLLQRHVLGVSPDAFLGFASVTDFHRWLKGLTSQSAGYLRVILQRNWQVAGAVDTQFLPDLPNSHLGARFAEPDFAARPDWQGMPHETGSLARQATHPLLRAILAQYGAGLLARLVARLVDLAKIPGQIRSAGPVPQGKNGIGSVETARGRLFHAVRLSEGAVTKYSLLAPTEWNFHPNGVAVQALQTLSSDDWHNRADALIQAIDPCVDFKVRAA
jgi:uptake hydrogenase large subunit